MGKATQCLLSCDFVSEGDPDNLSSDHSCCSAATQLSPIDCYKHSHSAHALQEWLLPHHTVFAHLTETVSRFFSTTCPASENKNEEEKEEGKEEWEEKGEEEFWTHHPALTPILSIPCDLIHSHSLYQVWEAKGLFKATASGRRSVALELSLLNTEALIHIAPSTLVPTYLCQ